MNSVLVLCEGNICRSPMAQGLLASMLPGFSVASAGLGALVGSAADPCAVRIMAERGIDITSHRAHQVTRNACSEADLILVMDREQKDHLGLLYPHVMGRVFRIGEYVNKDIPDPFRKSEAAFRHSFSLMEQGAAEWLDRIQRL